jgi:glycosyltransferase involved in cell wall biosynthesis
MERRKVVVIGQLPPPLMGLSLITSRMVEMLGHAHDVQPYNTAARAGLRGIARHLSRLLRTGHACVGLLRHAPSRGRVCYIACEGDLGLVYTILVVLMARATGYTSYLHHHSFSYIDRERRLMRLLLALGGQPTHVFLAPAMRARFEARYGPVAFSRIISNAAFIPAAAPSPISGECRSGLIIGHLSHLSRAKGLYLFLDLLRDLIGTGLDVRGILAGPVSCDADRRAIDATLSSLAPRLEYRGPVYGTEKARFYADIDIFVFPTQYANEAQPTVLFEASAAGCQILAFDRGCIAEQVFDGCVIAKESSFVEHGRSWIASVAALYSERSKTRDLIRDRYSALQSSCEAAVTSLFST